MKNQIKALKSNKKRKKKNHDKITSMIFEPQERPTKQCTRNFVCLVKTKQKIISKPEVQYYTHKVNTQGFKIKQATLNFFFIYDYSTP